jgi:Cobalamin biosynthesis protein CobN and related Mg-chelatases
VVRIFGTAPGAYGAGVEDFLGRDLDRAQVGSAYLAAVSHSYGGSDGVAAPAPGAFEARVATADLLVHSTEDPVRDLLEGSEDVAFIGGFAALRPRSGARPISSFSTPPIPRGRGRVPLSAALARIVRSRAVNPKFIAGNCGMGRAGGRTGGDGGPACRLRADYGCRGEPLFRSPARSLRGR